MPKMKAETTKVKPKPLLDLYHRLMRNPDRRLPDLGICCTLFHELEGVVSNARLDKISKTFDELFEPTQAELDELTDGQHSNVYLQTYWAAEENMPYGGNVRFDADEWAKIKYQFGPTRETFLLFLAAVCGEL